MKTIDELVSDHRPFTPMEKFPLFLLKWLGLSLIILGISYLILPLKPDLQLFKNDFLFHLENVVWFLLSLSSGIALYDNSFPDNRRQVFAYACVFMISLLFVLTFFHGGFDLSIPAVFSELSLWKGRCGFIVIAIAVAHSSVMIHWARKGAPIAPNFSAFWAAMSASALGCLLMQTVCLHNNVLHLLIWHFLPLGLICFLTPKIVGNRLRW